MNRIKMWIAVLGLATLALTGCNNADPAADSDGATTAEPPAAAGPTLSITSPSDGESVGPDFALEVAVDGIVIVAADGDTSGNTGHLHVFIDREPVAAGEVIPKEDTIIHSAANPIPLTGLSPGTHKITVVLGDGTHARIGDVQDSIEVEVEDAG
ncbi:MAG: DUF4399 domain-containing protein [Actinomycetota bacterium]